MIEWWDTPHGVQYQVVHGSDSESSDDEESLPKTTAAAFSLIPAPDLVIYPVAPPLSSIVTPTSSIPPPIEEGLTRLEEGQ